MARGSEARVETSFNNDPKSDGLLCNRCLATGSRMPSFPRPLSYLQFPILLLALYEFAVICAKYGARMELKPDLTPR
jgi:hypothetical protein